MAGYLPDEANAEAFVDGWYRTGDVGWLEPEGWVHLTDRSKEMIKVNGFQVAPAEVEAVLHGHPAVLDCAVFGVRRRARRRGAGRRRAARPRSRPSPTRSSSASWPTRWRPTSSSATWSWSTPSPGCPPGRCCAARLRDEWTPSLAGDRDGRADGRPALPRAAGAPRLGRTGRRPPRPRVGRASSTTPSGRPSSTPRSPRPAGASCGRPTTATRRWPRGSRWPSSPRSWAGAWPTPRSSARPWPPSCAGWPAPPPRPAPRPSRSTPDLAALAVGTDVAGPTRRVAIDAPGPRRPSCCCRPATATSLATVALASRPGPGRPHPADRPSPTGRPPSCRFADQARPLDDDDLAAGPPSASPLTCADLVGTMRGCGRAGLRLRRRRAASTARRSARSRPSSTCWPTPSWPWRARAASRSTPPGRSTPYRRRGPGGRRGGQGVLRPGRPAPCARPPSRCTAASATPGSAWPTCTSGGPCSSSDVLGGVGPSLERVLAHHGIGGDDGLR